MRIMMTLQGDAPTDAIDAIDAYLAAQGAAVLGSERLDPTEVATISASGDEPPIVERAGSLLRAVWILDVASRAAAVGLARGLVVAGGGYPRGARAPRAPRARGGRPRRRGAARPPRVVPPPGLGAARRCAATTSPAAREAGQHPLHRVHPAGCGRRVVAA